MEGGGKLKTLREKKNIVAKNAGGGSRLRTAITAARGRTWRLEKGRGCSLVWGSAPGTSGMLFTMAGPAESRC